MESRCGILCSKCRFKLEEKCTGCVNIKQPFWGTCPLKICCESKNIIHCGECTDFPCDKLKEFSYAEKEGDNGVRIEQCKSWHAATFMKYNWIDEYLMSKPGVSMSPPQWNWIRYAIDGKMFAAVCLNDNDNKPYYITLKTEPEYGTALRQKYEDIIPGYYMNKTHWLSVNPYGEVPDDLLKDMLDMAYDLVLKGLSKKRQAEIMSL